MRTFARESGFLPVSDTIPANYTGVIAAHLPFWPTVGCWSILFAFMQIRGWWWEIWGGGVRVGETAVKTCTDMKTLHCKKGSRLFPASVSLVSDIPAEDGKISNLLLQCMREETQKTFKKETSHRSGREAG